jgi:hypothetical protein
MADREVSGPRWYGYFLFLTAWHLPEGIEILQEWLDMPYECTEPAKSVVIAATRMKGPLKKYSICGYGC